MGNERPIIFSTEMVKAILKGRKTQTRRIVKEFDPAYWRFSHDREDGYFCFKNHDHTHGGNVLNPATIKCPYGEPGDRLWVRESWQWEGDTKITDISPIGFFFYRADFVGKESVGPSKWKPSIHMPKNRARIWLEVENVRVEQLQEISEDDAIAEGIGHGFQMNAGWPDYTRIKNGVCEVTQDTPRMSYATLWESIHGPDAWEQNSFCWVIKFKVLSTNGKQE